MKILVVHNRYRSIFPSGENAAVDRQIELLTDSGHQTVLFGYSSDEIEQYDFRRKLALPGRVVWSPRSRREIGRVLKQHAFDVVHVHNTFPLVSASILAPCAEVAPVVVSLHNYRLVCPQAQLLRHGKPCELCVGHMPTSAVRYGCYRDSRLATLPLAVGVAVHRVLDTWNDNASAFVALSRFASEKLAAGGLDGERMHVLPNFASRPTRIRRGAGKHFIFLGRLSPEKAPDLVVEAWRSEFARLLVVGDGDLRNHLEALAARKRREISLLGFQPPHRAMELLTDARALIVPSRVYEASPLVISEALARGVPVIAPSHGGFPEMVRDHDTGLLFASGEVSDLARCIEQLCDDQVSERMGAAALRFYEQSFSPETYMQRLLEIYGRAVDQRKRCQRLHEART